MDKKTLRKELVQKRDLLSKKEIEEMSKLIEENLFSTSLFKNASDIFIFVSYRSEVNTHDIIKTALSYNKNIYIPIVDPKTKTMKASRLKDFSCLEKNYMNILEPTKESIDIVDPNKIDLVIVPGLLFDRNGYRIGYGGGFYDKFFASLDMEVNKLGIGYDFQYTTGNIEHEDYDIPVNYFLSEKKFYIL